MLVTNFRINARMGRIILLLVFFTLSTSLIAGFRDYSVGADTGVYAAYYRYLNTGSESRFEPLFHYFSIFFRQIGFGPSLYFSTICIAFNLFYFFAFYRYRTELGVRFSNQRLLVYFGILLCSGWFLTAMTNGLRQGLALPLLYSSISFFLYQRYFFSVLFFCLAIGFHSSIFLVLPFIPLLIVNNRLLFYISFAIMSIGYPLGVWEPMVNVVSNALSLNFYSLMKDYDLESGKWVGFDLLLFLYSLFWPILFYFLRIYIKPYERVLCERLVRVYCFLLMPYLIFGFGAFSNRYAYMAWLFIPLMQAHFFAASRLEGRVKWWVVFLILVFGIFLYINNVFFG